MTETIALFISLALAGFVGCVSIFMVVSAYKVRRIIGKLEPTSVVLHVLLVAVCIGWVFISLRAIATR